MNVPANRNRTFEELRRIDESGNEYWSARELFPVLEYSRWEKFRPLVEKAKIACETAGAKASDHFHLEVKMIDLAKGAKREIEDFRLSRYACYLIVQNGDSSKPVIALGQTYFAIQTRRQELTDDAAFNALSEEDRRLFLRREMREHNKTLVETAKRAGVRTDLDYAIFQNHGYKGLYGGLDAKAIHSRKGLKKNQKILDHMGSTELAANLFRATQAEEKIRRENIDGKARANAAHYEVGKKVRETIKELGGTLPEDLPCPPKGIPQIERERRTLGAKENFELEWIPKSKKSK
ncbi:MAG TPA: DNA damage-inducible protein D [Candidatus Spyradosoma merdigallinarum]|uniref:DNA damage-inducible protein D n=1 Tax=Candidatus Spyradosoma merdigallinarum TaxID=2840950 RepID=A0A9D1NJ88_9BACT|nr:DNA damage-inducible protein D [Candidatus Spyradosoma merdigallinarum]